MIYIMACSRKSAVYLFLCFNRCYIACSENFKLCWASPSCRCCSLVCLAELQYQYHCRATPELHQLEFRRDIGARVPPMQAAPDPFKLRVSVVTSVLGHVRVGALPVVLSESRYNGYMTSVRHSKSVVVRLSDSDRL